MYTMKFEYEHNTYNCKYLCHRAIHIFNSTKTMHFNITLLKSILNNTAKSTLEITLQNYIYQVKTRVTRQRYNFQHTKRWVIVL